jgi:hypothetical protein
LRREPTIEKGKHGRKDVFEKKKQSSKHVLKMAQLRSNKMTENTIERADRKRRINGKLEKYLVEMIKHL